ncbi:hypothetical protein, partial [Arthrobacter cheniae]|uniref:hypothetical protein n=1 Tax=Arthrobacter cheniae TaxID=1258888 RepID=UPI001C7DBF32
TTHHTGQPATAANQPRDHHSGPPATRPPLSRPATRPPLRPARYTAQRRHASTEGKQPGG